MIQLTGVTKQFYFQHQRTLKELAQAFFKQEKTLERLTALNNVSFSIKNGEAVGIIGRNGAGKSTLLKLIAKVSEPTSGLIDIKGKVAPLIELGAGFHPELTGRENIFLNGVILGLKEKDIEKKFNEIVGFSEIKDFIDIPIKHYSSGMYMRLAFSVAIFTEPEILLVDEIFAVGDSEFQKKCIAKMKEFKQKKVTIILVTHDTNLVKSFCSRVLLLDKGMLIHDGAIEDGLNKYSKKH